MAKKEFATDLEIKRAHDLLLAGKPDFEKDKVDVIKSNESRDIKACPGSGKTTVLLAKLLILSDRMQFEDGSGICVITHTNVAVNEIKSRFGKNADILFNYPNFCGTIQSFVDQFLTIPWYNSFNEKPLVTVDDDRANSIIRKEYFERLKEYDYDKRGFLSSLIDKKNYPKYVSGKVDWTSLYRMIENKMEEYYYDSYEDKFFRNYGDDNCIASNSKTPSDRYLFFDKVLLQPIKKGILRYQDAYSIALNYLASLPGVKQSLTERFKYVFLDEAQDSSKLQLDVIDGMFDRDKTVVQRFGDTYQSLYDSEKPCAWKPKKALPLDCSKRFGDAIAKVLRTVCIDDNSSLNGNPDVHSVMPIMIVYEDPSKVLPKFVEMLKTRKVDDETVFEIAQRERNEDTLRRYNIKAIGHVGDKENEKFTYTSIKQYFPRFENNKVSKYPFKPDMTLNSFLQKDVVDERPLEFRNRLLDAMVAVLERVDVTKDDGRKFTKTTLLDYLEINHLTCYHKLKKKLSEWVMGMASSELKINPLVFDDVKAFIETDLLPLFGIETCDVRLVGFLLKEADPFYMAKSTEQSQNVYKEDDVEIEVATVHSVKGETHAATLYLETMYYAYESEHFGKQLCGEPYQKRSGDSRIQACLKVAYVGMSRPKYLLAYAIKKERYNAIACKELCKIWDIVPAEK